VSSATPELSIVVLGYRAGESLRAFVRDLAAALATTGIERRCEIVLVANYWPDTGDPTPRVASEIAAGDARCTVVARPKAGGMGWDMRSGLAAARGERLAVIDGDGQMPAADVVAVDRLLRARGADLAKTYRAVRRDGLYRRAVSAGYNLLFRALFPGLASRDVNSKPKVMTRAAYRRLDLRDDGWFIDAEIMIQARRLGLRIAECPTRFEALDTRPSFVRPAALLEFLRALLAARWREWLR
jgi:glycosyltransferase involved in cell wall biosynthesis